MAKTKEVKKLDISTEEKIKEAARVVFHKKGYAATRTRDIAEEAGINLALLNYYFRSKEKLFNIIMTETLSGFVQKMFVILNNEKTTLDKKVELVAANYIDLLLEEPEVPVFILSEVRNNPAILIERLPVKQIITHSVFFKQHQKAVADGKIKEPNPLHFLMNLIGLIVFPFVASPMLKIIGNMQDQDFHQYMQERKTLIPKWIKAMMKAS
ncbi:TetR family transcriptional regulator [Chryseobacterium angstadtii]|uniref:TetR family transcriptional regulator n=1 Tax=Chryseobacterium angstadtii TaxID=558151 RepID=A0A0J7I2N3_9FLAO|nr:TetR family transcriptional regulator [Chryseobacterium angstadtii]KMQ60204.1 TetR family transcriptional regulator [Chryseobacterium angstadtii]